MSITCPKCRSENPADTRFCGNCGTKLDSSESGHPPSPEDRASFTRTLETSTDELTRGMVFAGRYEIIEELGTGGMGKVHRVFDTRIKEEVALKMLRPEVGANAKTLERFRNEIRLARKIVHKNVCRMFDMGEERGAQYITMEYVPGEDLKSLLHRTKILSSGIAVAIAHQVADGLAEAHKLGIVHRDLKPGNIMIDKDGQAKIMDFGIARSLAGGGRTVEGAIIGTPEYMSPEQVEGKEADQRSDIYSLGVILFEMAAGRVPFQAETALGVAVQHKTAPPPDPRTLEPHVPAVLSAVILRCLAKDPADRFQTAQELKRALESAAQGAASATPTAGPAAARPSAAERGPIRSIAVLPFRDFSPQRDQEYFCEGLAEEIINALTRIEDLRVAARTSSFSFKGKEADVRVIGSALDVGAVLEGSVQKFGGRMRIMAQLVDAAGGYQLWSERFDRTMKDIFAVQDEISMAIVDKLKVGLREGEREKVVKKHTRNKDAYNLYLKGLYYWNRRYPGDMIKAVDCYGRAIRRDPEYVLPYVGIADVFNIFGQWAFVPPGDAYSRSKAALRRALEIDDAVSEIYSSLGFMAQSYEADLPAAEAHYRRSLELNPRNAYAHAWYSLVLVMMGRTGEAEAEVERAIALDPLFNLFVALKGVILGTEGRTDEGRAQILKAIALDPTQPMPYLFLGSVALAKPARPELAVEYLEKAAGFGLAFALGWLGQAYALMGRTDDALKILERLKAIEREWFIPKRKRIFLFLKPGLKPFRALRRKYVAPLTKALVLMGLRRWDEALTELEKSARNHDYFLPELIQMSFTGNPILEEILGDPRFQAIKEKIRYA